MFGLELDLLAMRSVYHHLRQDDDQALYWAAQYTKLVFYPSSSSSLFFFSLTHSEIQERAADMQHMPATHLQSTFKMVADLLVETGKWRLLKLLLAAAHEWISSYPITLLHAQSYQQQLATNYHSNSNDQVIEKEKEEEEEEEESEGEEDEAEGLETGSTTWWASQMIRDC